jgi:hypothetical protein
MVVCISTIFVTLSKVHWGGVLVFSGIILSIQVFAMERRARMLVYAANISITFFVVFLLFVNGMVSQDLIISFNFFYLISIFLFIVTRLFLFSPLSSLGQSDRKLQFLFFSNLLLTIVVVWLTNGSNNTFYLLYSIIIFAALVAAPRVFTLISNYSGKREKLVYSFAFGISIGVGTSLVYVFLRYRLSNNGSNPLLYWIFISKPFLIQPLILFTAVTTIGAYLFLKSREQNSSKFSVLVPLALLLALGSNFGTWLVHPFKPSITNIWQDVSFNSELIFSEQQVLVGKWIQINTPADSLVASSFQCSPFELSSSETTKNLECSTRNTLSWIVPLARRTALLESVTWFQGMPGSRERLKAEQYVDAVDLFARLDNPGSLSDLQDLGVDYVVIDKRKSERSSWPSGGEIMFETTDFYVLSIRT